jgi:hypothetical protein
MAGLVLPRSVDGVWPMVHELFAEQGYNGVDTPGTFIYESEWRTDVAPSKDAGNQSRYRAQGIRLPGEQSRVVLTRFVRSPSGDPLSEARDFELELLLYARVDPRGAEALERSLSAPSSRQ